MQGNEDQLIRLLLNLLDNALRYTAGWGRISLDGICDGANVTISISDSGPGIRPEHLPQLFDRFFRGDRARTQVQGGGGLGLPIARASPRRTVAGSSDPSTLGQGSTFTLFAGAG